MLPRDLFIRVILWLMFDFILKQSPEFIISLVSTAAVQYVRCKYLKKIKKYLQYGIYSSK